MPAGPLRFDASEVREVLRMIESESLDVRAVTMGVSLRDTASESLARTCGRIYEKLMRVAERLVPTTTAVHADFAVPITTTRLSVTPMALVTEASRERRASCRRRWRSIAPRASWASTTSAASRRWSRRGSRPAIAR